MKLNKKIIFLAVLLVIAALCLTACSKSNSDGGIFRFIYVAFGAMLAFFNKITKSYALALLLYALVFKIVFLPFGIKQQKNQIAMAKLRPKMMQIQKKYAGRTDAPTRQKMQQEIMELQQKEGYNPLSGCLPLLLQFPIIIFLYNVIRRPLSYICNLGSEAISNYATEVGMGTENIDEIALVNQLNAKGITGIENLPNFNLFGIDLSANPSIKNITILVLIPILAAAFQWLTMFLTKKWNGNAQPAADAQTQATTKMMDLVFPVMTLIIAFNFSAMLGLYWIYQSILGIAQSFILMKAMPLPTFTEEEVRAMEKAAKEQARAQRSAMQNPPQYKSLHYIDAEDADNLPDMRAKTSEGKKSSMISGAEMKDDDRKE